MVPVLDWWSWFGILKLGGHSASLESIISSIIIKICCAKISRLIIKFI